MHLLKASSKPVPQERKRRKIDLVGTPVQWRDAMAENNGQRASPAPSFHGSKVKEEVKMEETVQIQTQSVGMAR